MVAARAKKPPAAPAAVPARFAPVVTALAKQRGVVLEPGWGAGNLTLKVKGKIFVLFMGETLVAKLPRARVDELVDEGKGARFDPRKNGRVMKEWLVAAKSTDWLMLAREAHRFVAGT